MPRPTQIQRAAEQAAALPAQLLAFSRDQPLEPQLFDLNDLVGGYGGLLEHLLSEAIELVVEPGRRADLRPGRFGAGRDGPRQPRPERPRRDAVGRHADDQDRRRRNRDEADAREQQVAAGSYSVLSVVDSGEGMDAETAARAFEPFFTTKPHGQGSGLGLASVYGTVRQSGGFVRLESNPVPARRFTSTCRPPRRAAGDAPRAERRAAF